MPKVVDIAMWRNTVVMATDIVATDIPATDIVAMAMGMDIVATDIAATMVSLMVVITVGGCLAPCYGLITEGIMANPMADTSAGIIEGFGLVSVSKTEEECGTKRAGVEAQAICRL